MTLFAIDRTRLGLYVPKLVTVFREGYGPAALRHDVLAGVQVAVVALPLAMALAIASGASPERGLWTAIVAGFLISALGGSRFQVGGPTGAFVVVVFDVIQRFGYDGLVLATLMGAAMLVAAGVLGLGTVIKYIPEPVVTGFTAGIAVIIFSSQVAPFLGLATGELPGDIVAKWRAIIEALASVDAATVATGAVALATIVVLRRYRPALPVFLLAVVAGSVTALAMPGEVATIGTAFGGLDASLPTVGLPPIDGARLIELLPSAFTIAFLAGVESLLSAVVADGMTGRRHRSNCELVAQGVANAGSALIGGLPATGAVARTVTNVKLGARSPIAGIVHALTLLVFLLVAAPLAAHVPLAALAAVLMMVAWNMSEYERFLHLIRAPMGDRLVLVTTFVLTVLVDLTFAVQVGVVLAAFLFMSRMTEAVAIESGDELIERDVGDFARARDGRFGDEVPRDVTVFRIGGPFFFAVANRLGEALDRVGPPPRLFVLDLAAVPFIDATGAAAILDLVDHGHRHGTIVALAGARDQPRQVLARLGLADRPDVRFAADVDDALSRL